jgi:hypothetical protein
MAFLLPRQTPLGNGVLGVVAVSSNEQVFGVKALGVVTSVADQQIASQIKFP